MSFIGISLFISWDKNYSGEQQELKDRHINQKGTSWSSSFGSLIASHGSYQWRFKIIDLTKHGGWHVAIGIWKIKSSDKPPTDRHFTCDSTANEQAAYGYLLNLGCMISANGRSSDKSYLDRNVKMVIPYKWI